VSTDTLMWVCDVQRVIFKGDCLRLTVFACYSWEMALYYGLDASFDNMYNWKGIRQKVGEVNSTNIYITNDETSR
jgi:hypothetical protein